MAKAKEAGRALGDHIVLAVFGTHEAADAAIRQLAKDGVPMAAISIIGKNYHSEERAIGYFNAGDRARFFGKYGVFWGGLAGLLLGSAFFVFPVVGGLVVLGPLASTIVGGIEGAVVAGGLSALFGALSAIGLPKDSVVRYETAIKADQFVVTVHCTLEEVMPMQQLLQKAGGVDVESHSLVGAST